MVNRAAQDADYYKSLLPSQLVAERGEEIVVINPGSANLRLGLASCQSGPVQVAHYIARYCPRLISKDQIDGPANLLIKPNGDPLRGLRNDFFQKNPITTSRELAREAALNEAEQSLQMQPTAPRSPATNKEEQEEDSYGEEAEEDDVDFAWSDCKCKPSTPIASRKRKLEGSEDSQEEKNESNGSSDKSGDSPENSPRGSRGVRGSSDEKPNDDGDGEEGEGDELGKDKEEKQLQEKKLRTESGSKGRAAAEANEEMSDRVSEKKEGEKRKYRKFVCGDEALRISALEPYVLRRPILCGRMNISQKYSIQQVCDDLSTIWDWALSERLGLKAVHRQELSVVLVVPDTLDNREVKEMVGVVLRDLEFQSVVIHQESLAATFGNGIPSACVVNIGAQVTSIVCVEDGVVMPTSRIMLPFGGEDVSRCLLWLQERAGSWPYTGCDPLCDIHDQELIDHLKISYCQFLDEEQEETAEVRVRRAGEPTRVYAVTLCGINVAPMGFFYPGLLALEERSPHPKPWYHIDYEDVLDEAPAADPIREFTKKGIDGADASGGGGPQSGNLSGATAGTNAQVEGEEAEEKQFGRKGGEMAVLGLHQAIVTSILRSDREDLQKKLFTSIQVVGGCARTPGLIDVLEDRVLHSIPVDVSVDTVEVLPFKCNAQTVVWKGGAIMGVLDFARDSWIQREDWLEGGVRVGSGRKYKDSLSMHAQVFWYSATAD